MVLATFLLLGFSSVLPVHFFICLTFALSKLDLVIFRQSVNRIYLLILAFCTRKCVGGRQVGRHKANVKPETAAEDWCALQRAIYSRACALSWLKIPENDRKFLAWNSFHFAFYRFVEEKSSFEYGQVNHALAAAMRTLIKEYMILITQLEHLQRQGLLSLQKLWFYIQPTMRTLEILASLGKFQK